MVELIDRNPADACGLETKIAQRRNNVYSKGHPSPDLSGEGFFLVVIEKLLDYFPKPLDKLSGI